MAGATRDGKRRRRAQLLKLFVIVDLGQNAPCMPSLILHADP